MAGLLLCIFFYYHEVFSTKEFMHISRAIKKKTAENPRHNPDLDKNTTESSVQLYVHILKKAFVPLDNDLNILIRVPHPSRQVIFYCNTIPAPAFSWRLSCRH
jgi:hypothetical protein